MVGLPCLVSQCAKLHLAGWTWAVFTLVYLESCTWPVAIFTMDQRKEHRVCIIVCANLEKSVTETLIMIQQAFGNQSLSRAQVFQWHARIKTGRTSVDDEHRETHKLHNSWNCCTNSRARPSGSTSDHSQHCWGGGNYGTCQRVLTEELGMHGVAAKFVPRILRADQKQQRVVYTELNWTEKQNGGHPPPTVLPWFDTLWLLLISKNEIEAERTPGWYHCGDTGRIAERAWHSDRKGLPGSVPKMEETVGLVSTCGRELLRGWRRPTGLMVSFTIFTASVRKILDTTLHATREIYDG